MKSFIATIIVLTAVVFTSCTKSTPATPASSSASYQVNVEYQVQCTSGHFNVEYRVLEGNTFVTKSYQIDRTNYSVAFTCMNDNNLSIKAYNAIPSGKEVEVTILVNGVVFKTGSANYPGAIAVAEGTY